MRPLIEIIKRLIKVLGLWSFRLEIKYFLEARRLRKQQLAMVRKTISKDKIKVLFLVIHDTIWKYDSLFKLLERDESFEPYVVVIPLVREEKPDFVLFKKVIRFFEDKKYPCLSSFDHSKREWLDILKVYEPDLVFFTNPHRLTFEKYYSDIYRSDVLTCYVPYAFVVIHSIKIHYGQEIYESLWKYFVETPTHKKYAEHFLGKHRKTISVSGYPALDDIFDPNFSPIDVWKPNKAGTKRIIWAPHHTIEGHGSGLDYSCFLQNAEWFVQLAHARPDIQIAFKPHPLLKEKLYQHSDWGRDKTDRYYNAWNNLSNGQLEDSEYVSLFYYSDAMIMDSASFMVEYLYFHKPVMFLIHDEDITKRLNSFGQEAFNHLYKGQTESEIERFINEVVIGEKDFMKGERELFFDHNVLQGGQKTASENIYNELKMALCP